MSIANEIIRLQTAKTDIKTAIENKGVTVGDGTIDTYAEKINEISGGLPSGVNEIQTGSFKVATDTAEGQFVALTMNDEPINIIVYAENDVKEPDTHLLNIYGTNGILKFVTQNGHNQLCGHHGSNVESFGIGFRHGGVGAITNITKDGFVARGYTTGVFYFRSATTYHWIAWR